MAIKLCAEFSFTTMKIFKMVKATYSESAVLCATVKHWHRRFRKGRESFKDKEQSGRPATTKTDMNMARVAAVVNEDCQVGCLIEEKTGIPKTIIQ